MARKTALIIAHRGASAVAPESTRAAIREAARSGAQMIELDVQMTRDGRLIIFHDDRLERTTDGSGWARRRAYAHLARLDAGAWFNPRFAGERILLVSQALRLIPRRMRVNLELKPAAHHQTLLRRLRGIARRARLGRRLLVSSGDPALLQRLVPSRVGTALICHRRPDRSLQQAIHLRCVAWHPWHPLVNPRRLREAHAAGLRVHAWTVDNLRRARRLVGWGIDGLFTNHPARLSEALRRGASHG
ncbi:MAG: glycerophosphodiester phosphodiesterase family protein [Candidatus Omnitrophota bacterium]|nr:glycerophosphodiester phosphodiesterase family protein [Candidatus Omnitrophota bacterium]